MIDTLAVLAMSVSDLHNALSVAVSGERGGCSAGVSCHMLPLGGTVLGGTDLPAWSRLPHGPHFSFLSASLMHEASVFV